MNVIQKGYRKLKLKAKFILVRLNCNPCLVLLSHATFMNLLKNSHLASLPSLNPTQNALSPWWSQSRGGACYLWEPSAPLKSARFTDWETELWATQKVRLLLLENSSHNLRTLGTHFPNNGADCSDPTGTHLFSYLPKVH